MILREAVVAGRFYEADAASCQRDVEGLFAAGAGVLDAAGAPALPERIVGGIVPHAGHVFSGAVAACTLEAVARRRTPAVFVIFGAVHRAVGRRGAVFDRGRWDTPLGTIDVDETLAERVLQASDLLQADRAVHETEHSIEVQLPLLRHRFSAARILPILVPPTEQAAGVGQAVGQAILSAQADAVVLGSTDLTHYGPSYGFTPRGVGSAGLRWAKEENDAGVIDAIRRLAAEQVVPETSARQSACGGGAVAATLAAARTLGATRGVVLRHTTSSEVAAAFGERSADAVGYLSAVLG